MGNTQSGSTLTRNGGALDSFVAELGNDIVYEKSLGFARFLKTVKCRHRNGYLVVKIFIKPDPGLSLRSYHRRLKIEREALQDIVNVYGYQAFVETEKAGYIIRQWVASSLYDRISTRPFMSNVEKKWIAFQLLNALRDARNRKMSHGDIKSENILVTSWNWVYLSDFASYKPAYLPLDDPSDFSFYFDTSGRRTCYLAPERFYTAADNPEISKRKSKIASDDGEGKRDGKVTEAMDCFSAGCVIAELFLEGAPLFTLSQLFKYRENELSIDSQLSAIDDEGIKDLIRQMIAVDPSSRPAFDTLLHTSRGTVFPECFYSFLHNYVSSINELPSSSPFVTPSPSVGMTTPTTYSQPVVPLTSTATVGSRLNPAAAAPGNVNESATVPLPNDSDRRMERIWEDYESVQTYVVPEFGEETVMDVQIDYTTVQGPSKPFQDILPVELHIPNRDSKLLGALPSGRRAATEDGPALIILSLVCANVRNCLLPSSKVRALDVFLALSPHLTDEAKLDRMTPYIVDLLHDDTALVRLSALRTLVQVLMMVTVITPSNAAIFPEYIFPNVAHLVSDPEVSVRCMYAQCMAPLADNAVRYLEMGQALKTHGSFKLNADAQEYEEAHFEVSYDASMQDLQTIVQDHAATLLVDSSSVVKRAILHNISSLCVFLGRQRTNDVILSHMITYLNDREWLLRYAFFESIVDVAACAGGRSLEEYILPLMIQALSDVEESVVARVLASLTNLCELGLFQKMRIWELMSATLGFLYHPNHWIRQGAAAFIVSAAKHLPQSDVWCILYPSLRHFLRADVRDIDERTLLKAMKPPLSRQIFDGSVQWAMKAEKTQFWKGPRRIGRSESPKDSMVSTRKSGSANGARAKSEEDETHISKLRQLGMSSGEEAKLISMREYIVKLASAISSFASRPKLEAEAESLKAIGDVELQKLGVVPQTVFLKTRASESSLRVSRRSAFDVAPPLSPASPRVGRYASDQGSTGAPFEDLRRRLATINGSASSINGSPNRDHRLSLPPIPDFGPNETLAPGDIASLNRPSSPTESIISAANSTTFRAVNRWHVGSADAQKAAPAVGSSRANAVGLLETASRMQTEGSPERSGRSSPVSAVGTVRGRHRTSSFLPISSYDGREAGINNLLEHLYLDNNRDLQLDFGPKVHDGPIRRRNAVRHSFVSRDGTARRIEAILLHHFASHTDCVNGLAVSPDHMFFVSASDDRTVKVWDTARLERNVTSKPRHTYGQHHAKVKCVCMLEGSHCFTSAADDGSLHIVRVHVSQSSTLPKYGKLLVVREHRVDRDGEYITCMAHYNTDASSSLIYGTTHSVVCILDLRTMRTLQTMNNPSHYGPITTICLDRDRAWIVVGTATGVLALWDLRFGILLKTWKVGVAVTGKPTRIHQCAIHPTVGRGRWVIVAVETTRPSGEQGSTILVEVWDIERTTLVETYATRTATSSSQALEEPQAETGVDAEKSPASAIAALVRSRQKPGQLNDQRSRTSSQATYRENLIPSPSFDIRALAVGTEFGGHSLFHRSDSSHAAHRGFMVSGSEDRKIRLWDLARLERTAVLSGQENEADKPVYGTATSGDKSVSAHVETWVTLPNASSLSNRAPQRMSLINHTQQHLLRAHQDTVTAIVCIDSPFRGGIVSGDRAGVIKVWRVDGID